MVTYTTTYNLKKPTVADDEDVWGGYLNDSMDLIDDVLDGTTPVTGIDINSGTIDNAVIGGAAAAAGTFTALTANTSLSVTGNITVTGTVDGRDVAADGTKLDGIESGATADQTASEILTLIKTVDGSGTGLDADLWDGNQFSSYLNQSVKTDATPSFNNVNISGNLVHTGDSNTYLGFGTDTISLVAGNSAEVTINTTGVRLGDTGNGYFRPVSGSFGSIEIDGGAHSSWEGYSIGGRVVFMHDNGTSTGIYNDVDNEWLIQFNHNGSTTLRNNGTTKVTIDSSYMEMAQHIDLNNYDIYGVDQIFHHGDTNTYIQFHASDQFRVVTGGSERLEVNNSRTQIDTLLTDAAVGEDYDALSGTSVTADPDAGGAFSLTMTGTTSFTFGAPSLGSGVSTGFIIELTGNGSEVTWPTSVEWAGGTAPDAPASGETDIYVFWTRDGGTTWYGIQSIDAAS